MNILRATVVRGGPGEEVDFQLLPVPVGRFVELPRGRSPVGQYAGYRCVQRLLVGRFVEHPRVQRPPAVGRCGGYRCGRPPTLLLDSPVTG